MRAAPTGLSAIADIGESDVIVLVGFDPSEATPVLDLHIKRAVRRKSAKLIILNPRRIELARYTDDGKGATIAVQPGGEAAALNEIASLLQAAKVAPPKADPHARGGRPQQVSQMAGAGGRRGDTQVAPYVESFIRRAADLLVAAKSPLFIYGPDAARGERGRLTVSALNNIAALLGRGELAYIGHEPNGQGLRDMGVVSDSLPGQLPVGDAAVRERLGKLWGVQPPAEPGLSYTAMLEGGVKGLYVIEADPGASARAAEALAKLGFLVVQDLFLTKTARLAHVVLPATSWAESDGTYTNLERRVQRGPAGIEPVGDALPGWAILTRLAERWMATQGRDAVEAPTPALAGAQGAAAVPDWKRKKHAQAAKTGFAAKPWTYASAQSVLEEITKAVPVYAALRWDALTDQGRQWAGEGYGLKIEDSRLKIGENDLQPSNLQPSSFNLIAGPILWDGGVLMQHAAEQVRAKIPAPFIALNPADLSSIVNLQSSIVTLATVTSALASVTVELRADPAMPAGAAWMPYGLTGLPAETLGAGRGEPVSVTIALDHASLE